MLIFQKLSEPLIYQYLLLNLMIKFFYTKDILKMKHATPFIQRQRFSTLSLLVAMLLMIVVPPPLVQAAAPGNVSGNLQLWFKADAGVYTDTGCTSAAADTNDVACWQDQSSNNYTVKQATGANQPNLTSNGINSNPAFTFNGSSDSLDTTAQLLPFLGTQTLFIVTAATNAVPVLVQEIDTNARNPEFRSDGNYIANYTTATFISLAGGGIQGGVPLINEVTRNGSTGGSDVSNFQNGALTGTASLANDLRSINYQLFRIGSSQNNGTNYLSGKLSEVIGYDTELSGTDRNKIQSYLALKYGITLDTTIDYVNSSGTTIYPSTGTHSGYTNDIAGIGTDNGSGLSQLKSRSVNSDSMVTITGSGIADGNFLVWGNDDGATTYSTTGAPSDKEIMGRVWKVQETGTVGSVTVTTSDTDAQYLLVGTNPTDFSGATLYSLPATVDFSAGEYFTFAMVLTAPGGVDTNLQLWLRADVGVTTGGVMTWDDQSPNSLRASGTNKPTVVTDAMNFNPALNFNGTSNFLTLNGTTNFPTGNSARTMIVVATSAATGIRVLFTYGRNSFPAAGEVCALASALGNNQIYWDGFLTGYHNGNANWSGTPQIATATYSGNFGQLFVNGQSRWTNTFTSWNTNLSITPIAHIGKDSFAASQFWSGKIAEIILYNKVLSATERQQVDSYLSLKYGLILGSGIDYLASDGITAIYPSTGTHSGYINDIAGIGRDDNSGLDQRKSKSINSDAIVTIEHSSAFSSDQQFFIWGNDNGANTEQATELPSNISDRLGREWKVAEVNSDVGDVVLTLNVSSLGLTGNAASLLIDSDGDSDFTTGTITRIGADSYAGGIATFTGNLGNEDVFTLATGCAGMSPNNVVDNLGDVEDCDNSAGNNSLREAILYASAGDTITFDSSIAGGTIILGNQLTIDKDLTIDGTGQKIIVSGGGTVLVFYVVAATVTFNNLTIANGNNGGTNGGGINNNGGTIIVNNSSIINNTAAWGAGIFGSVTVNNSTVANNTATVGAGALRGGTGSIITVNNSTIADNTSGGGGAIQTFSATLHLKNTIVANNTGGANADCYLENHAISTNINNLIESGNCGTPVSTADPLLSALADNGGDTQTMALQAGSPAINAGDNATCESTDQRGETRPKHDTCDIGAYEYELKAPTSLSASAASQTQIALSWTDNSSDESGFKIERPAGTLITTTAIDATNYNDNTLSCGRTYSYSVKATNGAGDSTAITASPSTSACTSLLTVSKTGNGTINGTGINCGSDCQENILRNTSATLTATPDDGWLFNSWSGDCEGTEPTITITLDTNKTCTALFEEITCLTTNHLYVSQTASGKKIGCDWENAFTDLQKALSEIAAGTFPDVSEIWVGKGTYKPTTSTDRSATFQLINGVSMYAGFSGNETQLSERNSHANATTLSGDIGVVGDNSDNSYHVVTGSGTNNTAFLYGFTISGGNANEGNTCPNACGGGFFNDNGSPKLEHLFIRDNTAILGGGVMNWQNSQPVISKTFISNNNATDGGGIMNDGSHPVMSHVFVKDNIATNTGGGLLNQNQANPLLSHVNLSGNSALTGGGMLNDKSNPVVSHSVLSGNTATDGGGMVNQNLSAPTLSHVVLHGNTATQSGGAILNDNSSPLLTQSTLSGNSSGIVNRNNSLPTVNNSILWNNGTAITDETNSQTAVNYSIVEGGWAGNGNKTDDPLFVEVVDEITTRTTVGNFHLADNSPAIDAGNNNLIPLDLADAECEGDFGDSNTTESVDIDFDGRVRRFDGNGDGIDIVDMGAYEAFPSIDLHPLTVTITGEGSGAVNSDKIGIDCGTDCEQEYPNGLKVFLFAKPEVGSRFARWSGMCSGTEDKVLVDMTEAKNCEAQFDRARFSLDGITLICDDCTINSAALETVAAQPVAPGDYSFPQGLVSFELGDMVNPQAHLAIYYHNINNLDDFIYRKYGPTTPGDPNSTNWYNFSNVTIQLGTLDNQTMLKASLTLADGVFGDDTGVDGRIVDAGGVARAAVIPSTTVSTSTECATSSTLINSSCNAGGQTFSNEVEVGENASVAGAVFNDDVDNNGMISNSTVGPNATLTGGKLSGYIINNGIIANVNFVGIELRGGTLSGTITNNSQVGGVIRDVQLAEGAVLKGGRVSGRIVGDPDDPPLITATKILPGTYLSNVRLSPTVELPKNIVFGPGVILPSEPPTPADFGLEPEDIATLDALTLGDLEPAVFRTFSAEDIASIPSEAFTTVRAEQMAEVQKESLEGLTTEQFEEMPLETLGGLTADNMGGLSIEVLDELMPEHLEALDKKAFQQMPGEDISKWLTQLNATKITPIEVERLVPANWLIDFTTGTITAPVGTTLTFRMLPQIKVSGNVVFPTRIPDLYKGFGVGGSGNPLIREIESILVGKKIEFVLSQDENGILRVENTKLKLLYTFIPDADNAIKVDTYKIPVGLTIDAVGFYTITTPDGLQYKVIPAPQNPVSLSELFGGTQVIIGKRGDVLVELPAKTRRGGARQVLIFDPFVEPAPEDICVEVAPGETFCEFDNAPEHIQRPGLHLPTGNTRSTRAGEEVKGEQAKGEQAKVVYPNGMAQTVRPTLLSPDIFIQESMKFDAVKRMLFKANGRFYAFYQGKSLWVRPNFEVKTETVEEDGAIAPSITANGKGGVTYRIAIDEPANTRRGGARQVLIFDPFIEPANEDLCVELETGETFCEFDNAAEHVQP